MMKALIIFVTNILRTVVNYRFVKIFGGNREKNIIELTLWGLFCIATYVFHMVYSSLVINVIVNLLFLIILVRLYTNKLTKCLFVASLIYIVNMACDGLVYILFTRYTIGQNIEEYYGVITVLFIMIIEKIIEKVIKVEDNFDISKKYWIAFIIVPLISAFITYNVITGILTEDNRIIVAVIVSGILINNMIIFFLYSSVLVAHKERLTKNILEKQIEAYENQMMIYEESQKKYNDLKHDLKHHVMFLQSLIKNKDDNLIQYLTKLEKNYDCPQALVNCGNSEVDRILNYMLSQIREPLNKLEVTAKIPKEIQYELYDLNIILCNLLDNAIYAAVNSEQKSLIINMYMRKTMLFIEISNSYNNLIKHSNNRFITTKANGHGIGLEHVKKTVEKTNGIMDIKYDENIFSVKVMIYILLNT